MKRIISISLLIGSITAGAVAATDKPTINSSATEGFKEKTYLYEVVRYLYRWYMDEKDIDYTTGNDEFIFWTKTLKPQLDKDDNSKYGIIIIPRLGISVEVKKADYRIEELKLTIKSNNYKIVNISRTETSKSSQAPSGYDAITVSYKNMRDYLFKTRHQSRFPDESLLTEMRNAVQRDIASGKIKIKEPIAEKYTIYIAPLSPIANDIWVFLETGKLLFHFSSDIDLTNPLIWEHDELSVRVFDIETQTVVSFNEVAGSNAYMTRDQVGRALFNCIILGKKLELKPLKQTKK